MHQATQTDYIPYEAFLEDPTVEPHAEWVDGKVVAMSPVTDEHADLTGWLYGLLRSFVEAQSLGVVRSEPFQMKTGPDLPGRSPDVLFVKKAHLDRVQRMGLQGPADLAVEVVSRESRGRDRGEKHAEYEQGGVPEYWIIDPERNRAEFHQLDEGGVYRLVPSGDDGIYRSREVEGFWIREAWLWQRPLPIALSVWREWGLI